MKMTKCILWLLQQVSTLLSTSAPTPSVYCDCYSEYRLSSLHPPPLKVYIVTVTASIDSPLYIRPHSKCILWLLQRVSTLLSTSAPTPSVYCDCYSEYRLSSLHPPPLQVYIVTVIASIDSPLYIRPHSKCILWLLQRVSTLLSTSAPTPSVCSTRPLTMTPTSYRVTLSWITRCWSD